MDHVVRRERELTVDLESGGATSEEEGSKDPVSGVKRAKKYLGRVWSGILSVDESITDENAVRSPDSVSNTSAENGELFMDKISSGEDNVSLLERKTVKEKRKKSGIKKPPKPPRPPRGPSLDAADQKLVREISELAMLKRARRERAKAQKMKSAKPSPPSSSSSLCAMLVTLLFCLIIIFQGMFSRDSTHATFDGSPESATVTAGPLISVQYYKNPPPSSTDLSSESPNLVEQVFGSGPDEGRSRVSG